MNITLLMPELFPIMRENQGELLFLEELPEFSHFKQIVYRSKWHKTSTRNVCELLQQLFHVNQPLPVAALSALEYDLSPSEHYWLRADPIHCIADSSAVYVDNRVRLSANEVDALSESINQHLELGEQLHTPNHDTWLLACKASPDIETTTVNDVLGKNIFAYLPEGKKKSHWHRWFAEIQMLLSLHEVNKRRKQQGLASVDGLWLWGEGELKSPGFSPYSAVWSKEACIRGLAKWHGVGAKPSPERLSELTAQSGEHLVYVELTEYAQQVQGAFKYVMIYWLVPLLDKIHAGDINQATIYFSPDHYCEINRRRLKRWWKFIMRHINWGQILR